MLDKRSNNLCLSFYGFLGTLFFLDAIFFPWFFLTLFFYFLGQKNLVHLRELMVESFIISSSHFLGLERDDFINAFKSSKELHMMASTLNRVPSFQHISHESINFVIPKLFESNYLLLPLEFNYLLKKWMKATYFLCSSSGHLPFVRD